MFSVFVRRDSANAGDSSWHRDVSDFSRETPVARAPQPGSRSRSATDRQAGSAAEPGGVGNQGDGVRLPSSDAEDSQDEGATTQRGSRVAPLISTTGSL